MQDVHESMFDLRHGQVLPIAWTALKSALLQHEWECWGLQIALVCKCIQSWTGTTICGVALDVGMVAVECCFDRFWIARERGREDVLHDVCQSQVHDECFGCCSAWRQE